MMEQERATQCTPSELSDEIYIKWHVELPAVWRLDKRDSFSSFVRPLDVSGPPASLNVRSAFAPARYLRPHLP